MAQAASPPGAPPVSVIIPAYNAAPHVALALRSALGQSHAALEVIVVDDGSRDETPDIVAAIAAEDPRVRLIRQANGGSAAARNAGIAASTSPYLAFLDADDVWMRDKIARQVALMEAAGPGTGLVSSWSFYLDEAGRLTGGYCGNPEEGWAALSMLCFNFVGSGSAALVRRAAIAAAGPFDPALRHDEDHDFYLRIAERFQVRTVKRLLTGYRISAEAKSLAQQDGASGHYAVVAGFVARNPDVDPRFVRWSHGIFHATRAARLLQQRQMAAGLRELAVACRHDPTVLARVALRLRRRAAEAAGWPEDVPANAADLVTLTSAVFHDAPGGGDLAPSASPLGPLAQRRAALLRDGERSWRRRLQPAFA